MTAAAFHEAAEGSTSHSATHNNRPPILALFATLTQEKIEQYNAAARLKGLPITFVSFKELVDFESAKEDKGDRRAHAHDKFEKVDIHVETLLNDPVYNAALRKLCRQHGVPFAPGNIIAFTEDTSSRTEASSWASAEKILDQYIPEAILTKIWAANNIVPLPLYKPNEANDELKSLIAAHRLFTSKQADGAAVLSFHGPNAEIGPIIGAAGIANFFAAYATDDEDKVAPFFIDSSTCVVRRLDSPSGVMRKEITRHALSYMTPDAPLFGLPSNGSHRWLASTARHLSMQPFDEATIADEFAVYLRDHSARGMMVEALYAFATADGAQPASQAIIDAADLEAADAQRAFRVRMMSPVASTFTRSVEAITYGYSNNARDKGTALETLDLSGNLNRNASCLFFPAFNENDLRLARRIAYNFFSALDEKSLESKSLGTSMVVVNEGGMKKCVDTYAYLVNTGMAKDFDRVPELEASPVPVLNPAYTNVQGVMHKGFGLFDLVQSASAEKPATAIRLRNAAEQVIQRRRREYKETCALGPRIKPQICAPELKRDNLFKVAVFTSASNDNKTLLDHVEKIVTAIGKLGKDAGVVYGGGDSHAMGVVDSVTRRDGIYLESYSTPTLVTAETEQGSLPAQGYAEICPDIFDRMAKMIEAADVITVTPGGFGTVQELLAVLVLMDENPQLMQNKTLILHNPALHNGAPFFDPVIEAFLGAQALKDLTKDHRALIRSNIVMTTDTDEYAAVIKDLKANADEGLSPTYKQAAKIRLVRNDGVRRARQTAALTAA